MVEDILHVLDMGRLGSRHQKGVAGQGTLQVDSDVTSVLETERRFNLFCKPKITSNFEYSANVCRFVLKIKVLRNLECVLIASHVLGVDKPTNKTYKLGKLVHFIIKYKILLLNKMSYLDELTGSPSSSSCERDLVNLGPLSWTTIIRVSFMLESFSCKTRIASHIL
jgi:hypothetical protein